MRIAGARQSRPLRTAVAGNAVRDASEPRAWQVLIVENDPVYRVACRRTVESVGSLAVAASVRTGEEAFAFLQRQDDIDLLLLDLDLLGMSGLTLVHRLRSAGNPIEVIAVTAVRSTSVVHCMVQQGAIDYVIKPFTTERLLQALGLFLHRAAALQSDELDQHAVDVVCGSGRRMGRWLPKGLTEDGLAGVRAVLESTAEPASAGHIADVAGVARVTARRYLAYLVASGQACVETDNAGRGRPRHLYRHIGDEEGAFGAGRQPQPSRLRGLP